VWDSLGRLQHGAVLEDFDEVRADSDLMRFGNNKQVHAKAKPKAEVFAGYYTVGA
jgi:hypothetical protein